MLSRSWQELEERNQVMWLEREPVVWCLDEVPEADSLDFPTEAQLSVERAYMLDHRIRESNVEGCIAEGESTSISTDTESRSVSCQVDIAADNPSFPAREPP